MCAQATFAKKLEETRACVELVALVLLERDLHTASSLSPELRETLARAAAAEQPIVSSPVNALIQRRLRDSAAAAAAHTRLVQ